MFSFSRWVVRGLMFMGLTLELPKLYFMLTNQDDPYPILPLFPGVGQNSNSSKPWLAIHLVSALSLLWCTGFKILGMPTVPNWMLAWLFHVFAFLTTWNCTHFLDCPPVKAAGIILGVNGLLFACIPKPAFWDNYQSLFTFFLVLSLPMWGNLLGWVQFAYHTGRWLGLCLYLIPLLWPCSEFSVKK